MVNDKLIHVAVAVIKCGDRILIAKRPQHLHKGGFWEFPGGKVEGSESVEQALIRECREELAIEIRLLSPFMVIEHQYPEKKVLLDIYLVSDFLGIAKGMEGQPLQWCPIKHLAEYQFPEANLPILSKLQQTFF